MAIIDDLLQVLEIWRQRTHLLAVMIGYSPLRSNWEDSLLGTPRADDVQYGGKGAGLLPIGMHTFRHTCRGWLDSVGTPLGVQQKLMGHADIATTMKYGDPLEEWMRVALEKVGQLAMSKQPN